MNTFTKANLLVLQIMNPFANQRFAKAAAKSKDFAVWGFIIALHLLFFFLQLFHRNWYIGDAAEYIEEAKNIFCYGAFTIQPHNSGPISYYAFTSRPPLYPLFLIITYLFTGPVLVALTQMSLSILSIYLILRILKLNNLEKKGRI